MKVCKYARGHLVPEQRGRLIGKGPLPKEKLMKALGEVSSHCEIFKCMIKIPEVGRFKYKLNKWSIYRKRKSIQLNFEEKKKCNSS